MIVNIINIVRETVRGRSVAKRRHITGKTESKRSTKVDGERDTIVEVSQRTIGNTKRLTGRKKDPKEDMILTVVMKRLTKKLHEERNLKIDGATEIQTEGDKGVETERWKEGVTGQITEDRTEHVIEKEEEEQPENVGETEAEIEVETGAETETGVEKGTKDDMTTVETGENN